METEVIILTVHSLLFLNRYYDKFDTPRDEMYRNDVETAKQLKEVNDEFDEKRLFRDLRSGAESGWSWMDKWSILGILYFSQKVKMIFVYFAVIKPQQLFSLYLFVVSIL